jgi:DHA2 family multidrug resistance protein
VGTEALLKPLIERAAFAAATNEAWALLAGATVVGLLAVPFIRRIDDRRD